MDNKLMSGPPTLTVEETAELLGISRGLTYQAVRRGEIPSIRIGHRVLIPTHALRQLLGANESAEEDVQPMSSNYLVVQGSLSSNNCVPAT